MNIPLADLMYDLKRDWGQPVEFVHVTTSGVDPDSGSVGIGQHTCAIAQAVIFPVNVARMFIGAWKAGNFNYDSTYDLGSHVSLIQKDDFPLGLTPKTGDTIVAGNKQYEVKGINDLSEAYELTLVELATND